MQRERSRGSNKPHQTKPVKVRYINHTLGLINDEVTNVYEAMFNEQGKPISPSEGELALFHLERLIRFLEDFKEDLTLD